MKADEFTAMLGNGAIGAGEREKMIMELGSKGGAQAMATLMALGGEDTYFNVTAVRALSRIRDSAVAAYLETKLEHPDPRMVAAAAAGLAQARGDAAVSKIAAVLERNRRREDGHHDLVCSACVEALGELRSPSAISVLGAELEKTVGFSLHHEYGSKVVVALRDIGDPAAVPILRAYAGRLGEAKASQTDNPMDARYFQTKIDEVTAAIDRLEAKR